MNKLSNHYFKRYLSEEPRLATDKCIQEDMRHSAKSRGLGLRGPRLQTQSHNSLAK